MNIAHVIGIFSPEHGGPPVSLRNYAIGQQERGQTVRLYTLEGFRGTSPAFRLPAPIQQFVATVAYPEVLGASPALRAKVLADAPADVYHLHGIWLRAMAYGAEKARQAGRPYVIEINGALDPLELATKPWRKRIARWLYQDRLLHEASCIHVNSEREARHVRALGFPTPIVIIPAGFNTREAAALAAEAEQHPPAWGGRFAGRKILLYLARISTVKGIDDLILAWESVLPRFPDWDVVVVGPGSAEEIAVRQRRCAQLNMNGRIHWMGLVSDVDRAWVYRRASVYVLPSHKENFGNTVQEALGYGTPVITTTATPWHQLEAWRCGWVAAAGPVELAKTLERALAGSPEELRAMGARGRAIIGEKFSLERVVDDQLAVYQWVQGGPIPACLWPS